MNPNKLLLELINKVDEVERNLRNMIRLGRVKSVSGTKAVIDYSPGSEDEYLSPPIQWIAFEAGEVIKWRAPSLGEQVVVMNLSGGSDEAHAIALPAAYCSDFKPKTTNPKITSLSVLDVFDVTIDHSGNYHLKAKGNVSIESDQSITLSASQALSFTAGTTADMSSDGKMTFKGQIIHLND